MVISILTSHFFISIHSVDSVTQALMDLLEKEDNNGSVVTLNVVNGAKYV